MGNKKLINYEKEYRKVYEILLGIDDISEGQINRLVSVYGVDFIGMVLKYILKENSDLVYKIVKINSDLNSYLDNSLDKFSVYEDMIKNDVVTSDMDAEGKENRVCEKDDFSDTDSSVKEDDNEFDKKCISINDDDSVSLVSAYLRDLSYVDDISIDEKKKLLDVAIVKVNELNYLLKLAGSDNLVLPKKKRAWIVDKINYCINNCSDKELLEKINNLYKEYLEVRKKIIYGYLRFVVSIAKVYYKPGVVPLIDLVQFGNMGLMLAIEIYNYDYGIEFSTFAGKWVENHILAYSKKVMYEIRKPSHVFEYNNKRIKAINVLSQKLGRMPSSIEISEYTGLSLEQVLLVEKTFLENVSLDEEHELDYDGIVFSMREAIIDETANVEEEVIKSFLSKDLEEILKKNLNKRELQLIKCVYYDGFNFRKTADIMGVSSARVGQVHKKIITKLNKKKILSKLNGYL